MDRQPPRALSDEIELYIRTYYSLLRSSGDVPVRAFEEAHMYSNSSLHEGSLEADPDIAAFSYSAGRLPECMPMVRRVILGQSHEHFEAAGFETRGWQRVRTRGRRRPLRWDGGANLAVFVTSTSDIDDLVPILTAYQIEWNKLHELFQTRPQAFDGEEASRKRLEGALGESFEQGLEEIRRRRADLSIRLLSGSFVEYQKAAQRWWSGIEPSYLRATEPKRRPVYFVSSNTHSLNNLVGGYARANKSEILEFARRKDPEGLAAPLEAALAAGNDDDVSNLTYYLLRAFLRESEATQPGRVASVQEFDAESGISTIESPGHVDVSAQLLELGRFRPDRLDPRVRVPGVERLAASDAVIVNIDYPLGMAAYHHLSRVAQGAGELRGVYVMGKAATLNGRVGDVSISTVVHDEHSKNTYLFKNAFTAAAVQPLLRFGTVLDNQKALTVRSAFLQNRQYMSVFYRSGYTVLEMEAGPYLSAMYELINPRRHPDDEIVHLSNRTPFDVGILHYASDTPYSRRQSLLSKSLSYFGMESTYGCAIAIMRRILEVEVARLGGPAATL